MNLDSPEAIPDVIRNTEIVLNWQVSLDGGPWLDVGTSVNTAYITWDDPQVSPLYHTVVHIGSHNGNGIGGTDPSPVVAAAWGEFADCEVRRVDGMLLRYNHDYPPIISVAAMLADASGRGQCTAWADLLVDVLAAQGIGATRTRIERNFCTRLMPAQGTGGVNYVPGTITASPPGFVFHQVVRVDGFADTIFDPSYGTRTDKTDARSVELKYEDENITHLMIGGTWIPDTKGIAELVFTP